jgi:hypothetical protein
MTQSTERDRITKARVVYTIPGIDAITVRRDEQYRVAENGPLSLDLYYPPDAVNGRPAPAVVFVTGYSDIGARRILGCSLKEMRSYVSWAQLTAASGVVAATYTNADPAADLQAVLRHLRQNAASLGIDEKRIGVWACSGNVPNALSLLMHDAAERLRCAVLCYGYTLDLDGSTRSRARCPVVCRESWAGHDARTERRARPLSRRRNRCQCPGDTRESFHRTARVRPL